MQSRGKLWIACSLILAAALAIASMPVQAQELDWAIRLDGVSSVRMVAFDPAGNVIVSGHNDNAVTVGGDQPNETRLFSNGIFIAKFASDGRLLWTNQADADVFGELLTMTVDSAGNTIIGGSFVWHITLGYNEPTETTLTSRHGAEEFLAKYGPDGELLWATQFGGSNADFLTATAVDSAGNIIVSGYLWYGLATFGEGEPNETRVGSKCPDMIGFIAKYGPGGGSCFGREPLPSMDR